MENNLFNMKTNKNSQNISSLLDNLENKNSSNLSGFKSYFKENIQKNSKEKSKSSEKTKNKTIEIKLKQNNNINFIEFEQDFTFEEDLSTENEKIIKDLDDLSLIKIDNNDEFFDTNESLTSNLYLFSNLEKYNYLIENLNLEKLKKNNGQILKCLLGKKSGNDNKDCNCIPLIKFNKFNISFYCEHHSKEKNMAINALFLLENIDKIFVQSPRRNDENINNIENIIDLMKENLVKFKLNTTALKQRIKLLISRLGYFLKEKITFFRNLLNDYKNNEISYDEAFRTQSLKKIKNIYSPFLQHLNLFMYIIILKSLINEFKHSPFINAENRLKLLINFNNSQKIFESNNKKIFDKFIKKYMKKREKGKKILKFSWIIEFYLDDEIKYKENKNIFLGINEKGIIAIFSIFFFNNQNSIITQEKESVYNLIRTKKIESFKLIRITKLKKLFKRKENDNYYILNSMNSDQLGKALIINITENDNNINIKEKYEIKIVQSIKDVNGLYSSLEFYYKGKVYLLNYYSSFYLWIYDYTKNEIKKSKNENEIIDNKNYNYGPLIYSENKNLFIIQCFAPKTFIEFYKLLSVENGDKFNFIKLDKIIEFKEEESTLKSNNNYYLYKDKYLLLGSGRRKNNSLGGIYIIDLERYEKIAFQTFQKCVSINSIVPTRFDNLLIVSSVFNYKKFFLDKMKKPKNRNDDKNNTRKIDLNRGRLISLEIKEEENNKISLKINSYKEGDTFYFINCQKLFFNEYFFTSIYKNNSLIKLLPDGRFNHYCILNN